MQIFTVGSNQAGQRLDKFLRKYFSEAGSSFLYKMLRKKNITLNDKKADGHELLVEGDVVKSFFSEETYQKMRGKIVTSDASSKGVSIQDDMKNIEDCLLAYRNLKGIEAVYEDEHMVIFYKPIGILSQKAKTTDFSMNEYFIGYLLEKGWNAKELETFKPSVVNRLDRNTAGLICCGKSLSGLQELSRLIQHKYLEKYYLTVVSGEMPSKIEGKAYLKKDKRTNKVTILTDKEENKNVSNHYVRNQDVTMKLQKNQDYSEIHTSFQPLLIGNQYTLVEAQLFTGKSHQIRAHLSYLGYPMLGDTKYGISYRGLQHQLLLSYKLCFPKKDLLSPDFQYLAEKKIYSPIPSEFYDCMKSIFSEDKLNANLEIQGLKRIDS